MRVVTAGPLLRSAAAVLEPVRDDVTLIGALAVQVALDGHDVALTPTHDADVGSPIERANEVVAELERAGLTRSKLPHEEPFTWIGEGIKVQIARPFHPFPKGAAARLPQISLVSELEANRWPVAFEDQPKRVALWAARPAALVALKEMAFGRTRPDGESVDRDFSDAALLLDRLGEEIVEEIVGGGQMRARVIQAAHRLLYDGSAAAAAREMVAVGEVGTLREGEETTRRAAAGLLADLGVDSGG